MTLHNIILKLITLTLGIGLAQFSFAATCEKAINNSSVGSLTVPSGATCFMNATSVKGDVTVLKGGNLILNNSSVSGSVQASMANSVKLINSMIDGDLNVGQLSSVLNLNKSMISGNLYCSATAKLINTMSSIEGKTIGKCK